MTPSVRAYVGLGSNLRSPVRQIRQALRALQEIRQTVLVSSSGLYRSKPLGGIRQPDFINAVAALDTRLGPHELLSELQSIECRQGRVRGRERWGPRTLDLDLLLYGNERITTERLMVPHPGLLERDFVLHPLMEIAPLLRLPDGSRLSDRAAEVADELQRVDSSTEG